MFTKVFTVIALAGVALAQTFSINTPPSIQQCQPAALSWVGGTAPYVIAAIPAGQVSAPALANIASGVTGTSYSWTVNLAQGTAITIRLTDSFGNIAYSSSITVQAGTSSACLTAGASSGVSSAASSASGAASSAVASASSAASSAVASVSSVSSAIASTTSAPASSGAASSSSSVSRAASSVAAASSSAAAFSKASMNVPFLALAAALGCAAFGGFALLA